MTTDYPRYPKEGDIRAQRGSRHLAQWIFLACGIWLMGLGGYFLLARPPLMPEDLRFLGPNASQVEVQWPHLTSWLRHVFVVMGGFVAASGVLTVFVNLYAVPQRLPGTGIVLGGVGLLTVGTMSWTNFALDSDFKWLLLAPAILWSIGVGAYIVERRG